MLEQTRQLLQVRSDITDDKCKAFMITRAVDWSSITCVQDDLGNTWLAYCFNCEPPKTWYQDAQRDAWDLWLSKHLS